MKYHFSVNTKSNVNVLEDYSVVNYAATGLDGDLEGHIFTGSVQVSPHEADPFDLILDDLYVKKAEMDEVPF